MATPSQTSTNDVCATRRIESKTLSGFGEILTTTNLNGLTGSFIFKFLIPNHLTASLNFYTPIHSK